MDQPHYYSSKPTLLPTLLAAEYGLIKQLTGTSLVEHPFYVGRLMLILSNVLPLLLMWVLLVRWVEEHGQIRLGPHLRRRLRRLGYLPDDLRRDAEQSSAGGRLRDDLRSPACIGCGTPKIHRSGICCGRSGGGVRGRQ